MEQKEIAAIAVGFTDIIRHSNSSKQAIQRILEDYYPALDENEIINILHQTGVTMGYEFVDLYALIDAIQEASTRFSYPQRADVLQSVAQAIFYTLCILKGLAPPKWVTVINFILSAYQEFKNKKQ